MMNGRTEHGLIVEEQTKVLLSQTSPYVTDYYYTLTSSKEPCTRREYVLKIKAFLDFTQCDIKQITDGKIAQYFSYINSESIKNRGKGLSSSYQQQIYAALNGFFRYLAKRRIIDINPMDLYEYPKSRDETKKVALNLDEMNRMLRAVKLYYDANGREIWEPRDYLVLYMLMNTGMRSEMLREINIEDLDFENHVFTVVAKGGKTTEYIITQKMEDAIKKWLTNRSVILQNENREEHALFINNQKTRMSYITLREIVMRYSRDAGHEITPHKLRASFITNFYEKSNHDIEATREAAGHKSADVTLKHYIVSKSGSRQKAQNFMDSVLS